MFHSGSSSTLQTYLKHAAVVLLAAMAFVVQSRPFFSPNASLSLYLDNTYIFHPLFHYISTTFSTGEAPIWIRNLLGGLPFYNTPQFSIHYPLYFFWWPGLYDTPVETMRAVTYVTYLHFAVLYINMAIFLRVVGIGWYGALMGSLVLTFSSCMSVFAPALIVVASYAWLPLGLAGVHRIAMARGGAGWIGIAALGFTLTAMAAGAQSLIHAVVLAACHVAACIVDLVRRKRAHEIPRVVLGLVAAAALAVGIAGPNLITMALNGQEVRWLSEFGHVVGRGRVPYEAFLYDQSSVWELLNTLIPIRLNVAGDSYVGILIASLAVTAVFHNWRRALVAAYGLLAVYFLLSSTGSHLGLSLINYQIPLINMIRQPSRNLFVFLFAMAYLAGVGFDTLQRSMAQDAGRNRLGREPITAIVTAVILGGIGLAAAWAMGYHHLHAVAYVIAGLGIFGGGLLLLASGMTQRWRSTSFVSVALFIIVFAAWSFEHPTWRVLDESTNDYADYDNLRMHAVLDLVSRLPNQQQYRTRLISDGDQDGGTERMRFAMDALWYGVRTLGVWLNPLPNYTAFMELMDFGNRSPQFYRDLGVRYIVCTRCDQPRQAGLTLVGATNRYSVYADDAVRPAYWISDVEPSALLPGTSTNLPEPVARAANSASPVGAGDVSSAAQCATNVETHTHNTFRMSASCKVPSLFVLNEINAPEWRVTVNGSEIAPITVNGHQIGVPLRTGTNLVEVRYYPRLYMRLWTLSLGAIAIVAALLLTAAWRAVSLKVRPEAEVPDRQVPA